MEVPLTQGKFAVIDDADAPIIAAYKWWSVRSRTADRWYAATKIGGKRVWMHAVLTGYPMTDHRDCDGLNNRRSNLRPCTNAQNSANRRKYSDKTSRFKGVCWNKEKQRWTAQIRRNQRTLHLGYFQNEEEAAETYSQAAAASFGEFARA
jgi:hypothetical protein